MQTNVPTTKELFKQYLDIDLEPRGIWEYPEGPYQKKKFVEMKGRREGSKWSQFPKDNMSGYFLHTSRNLIIVDLDGCITQPMENNSLYLPETDMLLPETFHTITSNPTKQHHYYSTTPEQQLTLSGRNSKFPSSMDIFTFGSIFEGHPTEYQRVVPYDITPLPDDLYKRILSFQTSDSANTSHGVTVTSHPSRYALTKAFLNDELNTDKDRNRFYKTIFGQPNTKKRINKIVPTKHYDFNYSFVNDIATRLTATAELDFDEHVVPALSKILAIFGIDSNSAQSQQILNTQILRTLPNHASITRESIMNTLDIDMLQRTQPDTTVPFLVKVPYNSKVAYIDIDRYTLEPIQHGKSVIMMKELAEVLHPERAVPNEAGTSVIWDDSLPLFYTVDDPYKPQYELNPDTYQHTINLFVPTVYQKEARQSEYISDNNIVLRLMSSTVHPLYLDLMIHWHAHLVWGHKQLNIVPWIASPKQILGGTGKTQVTGTILTKLIGKAIIKVDEATFHKSWADIGEGVRSMSLQDFGALQNFKAFEPTYTKIKQVTDPMFAKQDSKHSSISTGKQTYQLSGTSNLRPPIPESDRRIFALEPAHVSGDTEPLTHDEAKRIDSMVKDTSDTVYDEFQEYMDYLLWVYNQPLSEEMYEALFMFTPSTIYRPKWINTGLKKGERLVPSMVNAHELFNISKLEVNIEKEHYVQLLQFIIYVYNPKTEKVGIPYNWFKEMIPYIISEQGDTHLYSVADIGSIVGQEFKTNVGVLYTSKWRNGVPDYLPAEWSSWSSQGIVLKLSDASINTYKEVIKSII